MRKYLKEYIEYLEKKAKEKQITKEEKDNIRIKISFFQHERLIHLLVTLFYVIYVLIFLGLSLLSYLFLIPFFIGLIFLIFYIRHYFFLENGVQYLYKLYDEIISKWWVASVTHLF